MRKTTILDIKDMKRQRRKIAVLTAYDYTMAKILDSAGAPILLVGDSLGMVSAGYESTLPVTIDEMIYHTRAVARGSKNALIVVDMPFLSYQISIEEAKRNAGRLVKEGGAEAVKLEGGENIADTIKAINDMGVPVMGHIGLMPQSVHKMGGYKVQGRTKKERQQIMKDAKAVEKAGAFSILLEGIPSGLAKKITESVSIPTIGIGAGLHCDGQVLVLHDMLGLYKDISPRFVKKYLDLNSMITNAVKDYIKDVEMKRFPEKKHSF
ncbi:MAG: 3-methyl-2-oxobutanoate hydroxymethyltransferase [Deltaproteobacteria bacterium]|nr:3-methyl-2-oxobutanoate hydroxymethyltransferase [Deltaproteobacteria bacterium]